MDFYTFDFTFQIIGEDVEDFIKFLKDGGYKQQAELCRNQFENQFKTM